MSFWDVWLADENGNYDWHDFEELGILPIQGASGIGMVPIQNTVQEFAGTDGAFFQSSRGTSRLITIPCVIAGNVAQRYRAKNGTLSNTFTKYIAARQQVIDVFKPRGGAGSDVKIRYRGGVDPDGERGVELVLTVRYDAGLQSAVSQGHSERTVLALIADDPFPVEETTNTATLDAQDSITGQLVHKTATGWETRASGTVWDACFDATNGNIWYLNGGGTFLATRSGGYSGLGGSPTLNGNSRIVAHGGKAWSVKPNGGGFSAYYFDGASWGSAVIQTEHSSYSGGDSGEVTAMRYLPELGLYFATHINNTTVGSGSEYKLWTFDGTTITEDAEANGLIHDVCKYTNSRLVVGGDFTTFGGVSISRLAVSFGATYAQLASMDNDVLFVGWTNGQPLTAVGAFTTIDGRSITRNAQYNGYYWEAGENPGALPRRCAAYDSSTGDYYVVHGGVSASADFSTDLMKFSPQRSFMDFNSASSTKDQLVGVYQGEVLIISDGTLTAGGTTTVEHGGSAESYPRLVLTNSTASAISVQLLRNETTGKQIEFGLGVQPNETVTIRTGRLAASQARVSSDSKGTLLGAILSGSQPETFALAPADWIPDYALRKGDNIISLFASDSGITASLQWENRHWSFDGGAIK